MKKLFALLLAGVMAFSLVACKDSTKPPVGTEPPNGNNEPIMTEPDLSKAIPEALDDLINSLASQGLTAEFKENSRQGSGYFLYPELDYSYTVKVSNGEEIYLYGWKDIEKANEHAACYSESGTGYTLPEKDGMVTDVEIDYVAPVHLWNRDGAIIEYASDYGQLYAAIQSAFGEEFAGAGEVIYVPDYLYDLLDILKNGGVEADSTSFTYNDKAEVCQVILNGSEAIYIYRYATPEDLLEHNASPIDAPVLATQPVWYDSENLLAIQYGGNDTNLLSMLSSHYAAGGSELPILGASYIRRSDYYVEKGEAFIITDKAGLDEFTGKASSISQLATASEKYTAEWFENNNLLVIGIWENSGSNRHEVKSVSKSGDSLTVYIDRIRPDVFTCDMAYWNILVEIAKTDCEGVSMLSPIFVDTPGVPAFGNYEYIEHFDENIVRTSWTGDGHTDKLTVIESYDALIKYYEANNEAYDLGHRETVYADTSIGFADTFETYTEKWFEKNMLLMGIVEYGSGSIRSRIDGVILEENGKLSLRYTPLIPETGTEDMAAWHLMVGIKKSDYPYLGEPVEEGKLYLYRNDAINTSRAIIPLDYITPDRLEDVKKIIVDNYTFMEIHNYWGEPDGNTPSSYKGEEYDLPNNKRLHVSYSANGVVDYINIYDRNPLDSLPAFEYVSADTVDELRDFMSGSYSYNDITTAWGKPDEETDGIGAARYMLDDISYVEITFNSDGTVFDVYIGGPIPHLDEISMGNIEEVKALLVGSYTASNTEAVWGTPDGMTSGIFSYSWYLLNGLVMTVEYDHTTKLAIDTIISDSIGAPEDVWRLVPALRNRLIGQVGYEWLRERWGEPDSVLSGFWGDCWYGTDNIMIVVYYDSEGIIEEIILHCDLMRLSDITADSFDEFKEQVVGKYTIDEITCLWGGADIIDNDVPSIGYWVSAEEDMFVQLEYGDFGAVTGVELISRTLLATGNDE